MDAVPRSLCRGIHPLKEGVEHSHIKFCRWPLIRGHGCAAEGPQQAGVGCQGTWCDSSRINGKSCPVEGVSLAVIWAVQTARRTPVIPALKLSVSWSCALAVEETAGLLSCVRAGGGRWYPAFLPA